MQIAGMRVDHEIKGTRKARSSFALALRNLYISTLDECPHGEESDSLGCGAVDRIRCWVALGTLSRP